MKKVFSFMLILIFVMGITGAAMAAPANPFVDVPANHWAYDAVAKLTKAGIVEGYGDGTFRGDRTATRYEMAQVTAKAMARSDRADAELKALIDKLAVEFAAELNNLGVRVTKLEEKTRIGWNFESRIRYSGDDNKAASGTNSFDWRQRICLSGDVNDNVSYAARLETSRTDTYSGDVPSGERGNKNIGFNLAYFNVNNFFGIVDRLTVGRFDTRGITNGLLNGKDANNDGVMITKKFGDVTFKGFIADEAQNSEVKMYNFDIKAAENLSFNIGYMHGNWQPMTYWQTNHHVYIGSYMITKSFDFGAKWKLGDFTLTGEYVTTKLPLDQNQTNKAHAIQITNGITGYFYPVYNLVDPKKAHTDAFALSYRKQEYHATPIMSGFGSSVPVYSSLLLPDYDVKATYLTYQNVVSKNVVWTAEYQDLKGIGIWEGAKDKVWNTSFQFFF